MASFASVDPLNAYSGPDRKLRDEIKRIVIRAVMAAQSGGYFPGTIHTANEIMEVVKANG